MIQKIRKFMVAGIASFLLLAPVGLVPSLVAVAVADDNNITKGVCTGTHFATDGTDSDTGCTDGSVSANDQLKKIAAQIVNILSIVVGIIAVIMIIVGGFRYITSGGDSSNVSGAKNTLIYAIVGLIIVALAQFIVHYVLSTAGSVSTN